MSATVNPPSTFRYVVAVDFNWADPLRTFSQRIPGSEIGDVVIFRDFDGTIQCEGTLTHQTGLSTWHAVQSGPIEYLAERQP